MGHDHPFREVRLGRSAAGNADRRAAGLSAPSLENLIRAEWWGAVATVTRLVGDVGVAEEAIQEACVAALQQWPRAGVPTNPRSWLIGTARHKAVDWLRREAQRAPKEELAVRDMHVDQSDDDDESHIGDDQLALIFTCCHPALDPAVRVPLTLRTVCGLKTGDIAAVYLMAESTMAQRLVRAKRKIRDAGIPFRVPSAEDLADRTADVMRVVYLVYTEGHRAGSGPDLVRDDLCEEATRLARELAELMPDDPEVLGLLALLLLTDARRATRTDAQGRIVVLRDQDRRSWDATKIKDGSALVEAALRRGRPGPYQLQAAIAACHASAASVEATDWAQIAALYRELLEIEPSGVVAANRGVAVAMAEGADAGLEITDALLANPEVKGWAPLHVARGGLLEQVGRHADAVNAYRTAAGLHPPRAELEFILERIALLTGRAEQQDRTIDQGSDAMPSPEAGIEAQIRNIEATYGRSRSAWYEIIRRSGRTKHNEVVALLKSEYGLKHGAAHRLSLLSRQQEHGAEAGPDHVDQLYAGNRASLRRIHDTLIEALERFGQFEIVPKKGYVSLRRAKQFAMIQPSTTSRVDLGLILPGVATTERLESAARFNALFTHRVRIETPDQVDAELVDWLGQAYERAGGQRA